MMSHKSHKTQQLFHNHSKIRKLGSRGRKLHYETGLLVGRFKTHSANPVFTILVYTLETIATIFQTEMLAIMFGV